MANKSDPVKRITQHNEYMINKIDDLSFRWNFIPIMMANKEHKITTGFV